jgi:8-oxo-dGTP diphosphatase
LNGTTTVSKTVDGGSIPSTPAKRIKKPQSWFFLLKMKPFSLMLADQQFPFTGVSQVRRIARAMLENDQGLFAFLHILFDDKFGHRDYLETPGGGIEDGETPDVAVIREIEEECGLKSKVVMLIGEVKDAYNLIQRQNHQFYYYAKVVGQGQKLWTAREHQLIHQLHWLTLADAQAWYSRLPDQGISQLIKQRELPCINWMIQYKQSIQNK